MQDNKAELLNFLHKKTKNFKLNIVIVSANLLNVKLNCGSISDANKLLALIDQDSDFGDIFEYRPENFQARTSMFDDIYRMASNSATPRQFSAANQTAVKKVIVNKERERIVFMNKLNLKYNINE